MRLYIINETIAKQGARNSGDESKIYTDKKMATRVFRQMTKEKADMFGENTRCENESEETASGSVEKCLIYDKDKKLTDYHEITLTIKEVYEVERTKVEPGFEFLSKIHGKELWKIDDFYLDHFYYFRRFGKMLNDNVNMRFDGKRVRTRLERTMIKENKLPKPYYDNFGCVIEKDGYEILISCYYDGEFLVNPYAYEIKSGALVSVTSLCPKLKKKLGWKNTPDGYEPAYGSF